MLKQKVKKKQNKKKFLENAKYDLRFHSIHFLSWLPAAALENY